MNVIYKRKVWKVIAPKNLEYPPDCIRNVWIERGDKSVITNIKEIRPIESKFKDLSSYF